MSTQKVSERFQQSWQELRQQPVPLIGTTLLWGILIYAQDYVWVAGPVLTGMATTLLLARLFKKGQLPIRPLLALGVLVFPINALWTILFALLKNTVWVEAFSSGWAVPLIFCVATGMCVITNTACAITTKNIGLDQGLKQGWWAACMDFKIAFWVVAYITATAIAAFATSGVLFILMGPFALALLKTSAQKTYSEAGVRT